MFGHAASKISIHILIKNSLLYNGYWRFFPGGVKCGWGMLLTTHPPSSGEVKKEWELYLLFPQVPLGV
jgi:hypothetical protein